jgi:hypothetical protein
MAAASVSAKSQLNAALKKLEKKYGVTKTIGGGPSLEQCLFLILRQGWDFKKASRAVRILESSFIDWNEVRASSLAELYEVLAALKCTDLMDRLRRLRGFLNAAMDEVTDLTTDMFRSMDFEPLRRFIVGIEPLGKANAYVFLQCFVNEWKKKAKDDPAKERSLVVSPEAMRVTIRLGIIKKTQSSNKARADFSALITAKDYLRFQYLMAQHAESVCSSKKPLCGECFLRDSCNFPSKEG